MRTTRRYIALAGMLFALAAAGSGPAHADETRQQDMLPTLTRLYGITSQATGSKERSDEALLPGVVGNSLHYQVNIVPDKLNGPAGEVLHGPPEAQAGYHGTAGAHAELGDYYAATRVNFGDGAKVPGRTGLQLSMDAGAKRNALNTGVMYAYRAGYLPFLGGENKRPGGDGLPFFIFSPGKSRGGGAANSYLSDAQAIFFYVGYDLSEQLKVRGSLGFAKVKKTDKNEADFKESSRRWGIDLAASYKLLDNLVYETHLGYVNVDETNTAPSLDLDDNTATAPLENPSDIYQISNQIRMTF